MEKTRIFRMDGDEIAVLFRYDKTFDVYLGSYPDFVDEPRYTPNGRPWKSVVWDECPYAPQPDNDCGSCEYLRKEQSGDLIGVCFHEALRQAPGAVCGDA